MADWSQIVPIVAGIGGLVGGAGGLAALLRARSQNKVDERTQLSAEQQAFRRDMAAELATLRTAMGALVQDKEKLETRLDEQREQLVELRTLDRVKTSQIEQLQARNSTLEQTVAAQQQQIKTLDEQKSSIEKQLLNMTASRDFLERENTQLRRENELLRAGTAAHPSGNGT